MKIVRVTQNSLKRAGFSPIRHQLRPDLQLVAIAPKVSVHPSSEPNRNNGHKSTLFGWLLPEGFPSTVHSNYLKFTMWTMVQGISSSFIGVLSTQAMLGTLMEISSGEPSIENGDLKNSAAATINWILKDGLGQAGGIALVSLLGSSLDCQARSLRFHSTLLFIFGSFLEFSIPFACTQLGSTNMTFLVMASTANIMKNVSWMLVSATRAHFMKNFALKGNLGDLTGKAASQMTCSSLIGTGLGLLVLKCFPNTISGSFLISSIIGLFSTFKSCKVGLSRQLNTDRVFKLVETLSNNYSEDEKNISRYIWTPEILAERENFIWNAFKEPQIIFNAALNTEYPNMEWIASIEDLETRHYAIAKFSSDEKIKYYVWFLEIAGSEDELNSIVKIAIDHFKFKIGSEEILIEAMKKQGWDTEHFNCKAGNKDGSIKLLCKEE